MDYAKEVMSDWAKDYSKCSLWYFTEYGDRLLKWSEADAWYLSDPDFFYAAIKLLPHSSSYMIPIRYERNVPIDKDWKPAFSKQVCINGTVEEAQDDDSAPVKEAHNKLEWLDYSPLNWDKEKNSKYSPKK